MTDENAGIDWEQLHELSDNDTAFEQELLHIFLDDALKQIDKLQTAWQQENLPEIYQTAHYLKGASANVGAIGLMSPAAAIEAAAKSGLLQNIAAPFEQLKQGIDRLSLYLKRP